MESAPPLTPLVTVTPYQHTDSKNNSFVGGMLVPPLSETIPETDTKRAL